MSEENLERLTECWKATKAALTAAQERHLQSEIDLYNAVKDSLPDKGTMTLDTGLKITCGYSEKWDQGAIDKIYRDWPSTHSFPFSTEWKADGKSILHYRDNEPGLYKTISEALTMTPRKPSFTLKTDKE